MAGGAAPEAGLLDALVGGDFDPAAHDAAMAAAFGDDYYAVGGQTRLPFCAFTLFVFCGIKWRRGGGL